MLKPKTTKYKKYQKGNIKNKTSSLLNLNFGHYGLKALESG
jgi:large subunit ribosomal protein L16